MGWCKCPKLLQKFKDDIQVISELMRNSVFDVHEKPHVFDVHEKPHVFDVHVTTSSDIEIVKWATPFQILLYFVTKQLFLKL